MADEAGQPIVHHVLRPRGLERRADLCHGRCMARRTPMAGGFFLMAAIVGGAVWGIMIGNPMKGLLIGTGVGIAAAVLVWLVDRLRD
jgi:energy-converting hydrogenase Eha subunit B